MRCEGECKMSIIYPDDIYDITTLPCDRCVNHDICEKHNDLDRVRTILYGVRILQTNFSVRHFEYETPKITITVDCNRYKEEKE